MSQITATKIVGDVVLSEQTEFAYSRELVTLIAGAGDCIIGQVLGRITTGGKYTQVAPAAHNGSESAYAVLVENADATGTYDVEAVVIRRAAIFKSSGLVWTTGMTAPQIAAAKLELADLSMPVRSDL